MDLHEEFLLESDEKTEEKKETKSHHIVALLKENEVFLRVEKEGREEDKEDKEKEGDKEKESKKNLKSRHWLRYSRKNEPAGNQPQTSACESLYVIPGESAFCCDYVQHVTLVLSGITV